MTTPVMLALIVPVLKNFRGLAELFASVDVPVLPIVLDNWVCNRGVAPAWNAGLQRAVAAGCDYAVIANDDVILRPGTLHKLCEPLDPQILMTSATNEIESPFLSERPDPRYAIDFACFAVQPSMFMEKMGSFDENFRPAYFEDADMRYRLILLGYDGVAVPEARIYHRWSTTQNMDGPVCSHEQFRTNRDYYIRKWGGEHKAERYSRPFGDPRLGVNDWSPLPSDESASVAEVV